MNKLDNNHFKTSFVNLLSRHSYVRWLVFILSILVYINSVPNKWAVDDTIVVHGNKYVKRGVSGLDSLFTQETFSGFYGQNIHAVAGGRWRPLSPAIFALEAELLASVKKDNQENIEKDEAGFVIKDLGADTLFPNILHFINVLLYGGLCVVLYNLLLLIFNPQKDTNNFKADFISAVTTLIFVVHPLHTEVVANIKSIDEILTLLGSLLSIYCLLKAWYASKSNDNNAKIKWWVAAAFSYLMALLAKESATTFLMVIPLVFWFFTTANLKEIAILVSPLIVVFLVFFEMRTAVLGTSNLNTFESHELMNNPFLVLNPQSQYEPLIQGNAVKKLVNYNPNTYTQMPFANELATNIYTWGIYLKLLIVPYPLTSDYYPRYIEVKDFSDPLVLIALILNIGLLGWAISQIKRRNIFAFGILYYFITFSIVSNLFFPIGTNMGERFMFMPSVGICLIYGLLFYNLSQKLDLRKTLIVVGLLLVVYSFVTIARNPDWKNDLSLSKKDVQTSQNSARIKVVYASEMIKKAQEDAKNALLQVEPLSIDEKKAALKNIFHTRDSIILTVIPSLKEALEIHPIFNTAWIQLGAAYFTLSKNQNNTPNQTFTYLLTALEAYKQADFYKGVGMGNYINKDIAELYINLGRFYGETLYDIDKSITCLEKAKELNPKSVDVYFLLGTAYSVKKDYQNMLKNTEKSYEMQPNDATKENLAVAYQIVGANTNNKELFIKAEKMLLEIYESEKNLPENALDRNTAILRTLDLIQRNYTLQGNTEKLAFYKTEMAKFQK